MSFQETIKKAGINEAEIIEWRKAKIDENAFGETGAIFRGYLILTKNRLMFVSKKSLLKSVRKRFDISLDKIKKISKFPLSKRWSFQTNLAQEGDGALKRFFKQKTIQVKIDDGEGLVETIKEMNINIK